MQPPQLLRDEGVAGCPGLESRPLVLQLPDNSAHREDAIHGWPCTHGAIGGGLAAGLTAGRD